MKWQWHDREEATMRGVLRSFPLTMSALVLLLGACGAPSDSSSVGGPATSTPRSAPSPTNGTGTSTDRSSESSAAGCIPVGEPRDLPVADDFDGECRLLDIGSDATASSDLVNGMLEVTVAGSPWFAWVDLTHPVRSLSVGVTVKVGPADTAPAAVTLMCLGPVPSLDRFFLLSVLDPASPGVGLFQMPENGKEVLLERADVPPLSAGQRVRLQFDCSTDDADAQLTGGLDDTTISATANDVAGYVPFQAIGVRVDTADGSGRAVVRLDDFTVGG